MKPSDYVVNLVLSIILIVGVYQFYFWCQRNYVARPREFRLPIDDAIPYWPRWVWIYSCLYYPIIVYINFVMDSPRQFVHVAMSFMKDDADSVSDADAEQVLATIEKQIHRSPNWARYAMNGALISIGVFKPTLRKKAIEAAQRIGKVEIDHGETNCKTPDAVPYIEKASKRKRCP